MDNNLYVKLQKIREAISKESFNSFSEFKSVVNKLLKKHNVLPLYCIYDNVATLSLVDIDNITLVIKFQIPVGNVKTAKEQLYKMAFDVDEIEESITPKQYIALMEKMKECGVSEKEILERYKIKSLADVTTDIYKRCMSALDKTKKDRQQS